MKELLKELESRNLTLGSVESLTGGLFASEVTSIPGASHVFKGTVVTYATEIKESVVGVSHKTVEEHGVVSKECAFEMAYRGAHLLDTDVCISFTGNAGPSAMEGKPVGCIYVGVYYNGKTFVQEFLLGNQERNVIRHKIVDEGVKFLLQIIKENF